jgi:hypothetical protein
MATSKVIMVISTHQGCFGILTIFGKEYIVFLVHNCCSLKTHERGETCIRGVMLHVDHYQIVQGGNVN